MNANIKTAESLEDLLQHAEEGDAGACAKAGHIYAAGSTALGIAPDRARAIHYYEKGGAIGDLPCLYGLAGCYLADEPEKAIPLLQQCAERKYIWALATLGDFYLRGRHVPQDAARAREYLRAYTTLARPDVLGESVFRVRWDLVLYPLCLVLGIGGEKDEATARAILKKLADAGNISAIDVFTTGTLDDWMAAKRFGHDTKTRGSMPVFSATSPAEAHGRSQVPAPRMPRMKPAPRVNKRTYETVAREKLSRFLQRSLIPGEPVLMHGAFPRIYTIDSCLRLIIALFFGRWVEHVMIQKANIWSDAMPEAAALWLYSHPQLPVVIFGLIGLFDFMRRMIRKWTTEIVLTDKRFIYKQGFISIKMIQMNFWQIEHSDVSQSILGSWLDYGRVHIRSYAVQAGENTARQPGGVIILPPISHPFLFSRLIEDNRQLPYKMRGGGQTVVPMWSDRR